MNEAAVADSASKSEEDVNAASCAGEASDLDKAEETSSVYARQNKWTKRSGVLKSGDGGLGCSFRTINTSLLCSFLLCCGFFCLSGFALGVDLLLLGLRCGERVDVGAELDDLAEKVLRLALPIGMSSCCVGVARRELSYVSIRSCTL